MLNTQEADHPDNCNKETVTTMPNNDQNAPMIELSSYTSLYASDRDQAIGVTGGRHLSFGDAEVTIAGSRLAF